MGEGRGEGRAARLEVVVMVVETVVGELVEEHLGHMWHACAVRVPCAY